VATAVVRELTWGAVFVEGNAAPNRQLFEDPNKQPYTRGFLAFAAGVPD